MSMEQFSKRATDLNEELPVLGVETCSDRVFEDRFDHPDLIPNTIVKYEVQNAYSEEHELIPYYKLALPLGEYGYVLTCGYSPLRGMFFLDMQTKQYQHEHVRLTPAQSNQLAKTRSAFLDTVARDVDDTFTVYSSPMSQSRTRLFRQQFQKHLPDGWSVDPAFEGSGDLVLSFNPETNPEA